MLGLVWAFPHDPPYCFRFTLLRDLNLDVFFKIGFHQQATSSPGFNGKSNLQKEDLFSVMCKA